MSESKTNWTGVAFGLTLACFAAYQQFKMPPALPLMLEAYGYDSRLAGGFMSAYALAGLFLSLPLGRVIARRGAGWPVAGALALMALGSVATLLLPGSGLVVLAARTLEGVAFAVLAIAGPVLANGNASPRHLQFVIAGTAAWIPVGQLVAVLGAQPLFALVGWPGLWWLGLVLTAALAAWLGVILLRRQVDLGGRPDDDTPRSRSETTQLDRRQKLSMALAGAVFMLWSGQYFGYMTWLPQYLVDALGLSVDGALAGYALPVSMLLIAIPTTGQLLNRGVPVGRLLIGGLIVQTLSWLLLPLAGEGVAGALLLVLYGLSAGVVPTCLFAMPSVIVGQGAASARAFGIMMTGRTSGVLVGPLLLAQALELSGGWTWAAPLLGGMTAAALALGLWLARRVHAAPAG
jgi:predicted MFS family arabinose efflux permease